MKAVAWMVNGVRYGAEAGPDAEGVRFNGGFVPGQVAALVALENAGDEPLRAVEVACSRPGALEFARELGEPWRAAIRVGDLAPGASARFYLRVDPGHPPQIGADARLVAEEVFEVREALESRPAAARRRAGWALAGLLALAALAALVLW